jgi:hypothetical protein
MRAQGLATQLQRLESRVTQHDETISGQQEKIERQQHIINQLVLFTMSSSIYYHLWFISETIEYHYHNSDWFSREMYYLRDNGYSSRSELDSLHSTSTSMA